MKSVYFPGLNGIRFIAAFLVILDHIELLKGYMGIPTLWNEPFSAHLGNIGVTIFFVLSGFLITYLLLSEKSITDIKIAAFYIRRILRIWPLYYLIIILGFFILPYIPLFNIPHYATPPESFPWPTFLTYGTLLANFGFIYCSPIAFAGILWSVAVEEQFYLVWPIIVKYVKSPLRFFIVLLIFYFVLKIVSFFPGLGIQAYLPHSFYHWLDRTRISCMIIGGIGAYLLFTQAKFPLRWTYSRANQFLQMGIFILVLSNILSSSLFNFFKNEFFAVNIILLILNIAANPNTLIRMENVFFHFLGKISYGLYVYHLIIAAMVIKGISNWEASNSLSPLLSGLIIIIITTLLTILISHLSYRYFESYFLRIKNQYSIIQTG